MKQERLPLYEQWPDSGVSKWFFERRYWNLGYSLIAGIDETGRGTLCGPVLAAAVIFRNEIDIVGLDDSKKIAASLREQLYDEIREKALAIGIGLATTREIDNSNILEATRRAMTRAVAQLSVEPQLLLIDAVDLPDSPFHFHALVKGDQRSSSIAAASIIAKVVRDRLMCAYHRRYPAYGLHKNKGYGTLEHRHAIRDYGPCPLHRTTFRGVREFL